MDGINVVGELSIFRRVAGCDELVFKDNNLITDVGLTSLPWLLAGAMPAIESAVRGSDMAVQRMEIGTDAAAIPTVTDLYGVSKLIYAPPVEINVESGFPAALSFGGYMPPEVGNDPGNPTSTSWYIREEALILGNGFAFAKKIFAVKKNSTFGLYFRHRINFVRG